MASSIVAGFEVPNEEYYLSWDQRHTVAAEVFVGDPENYGINLVWRWNTPRPYTYYPSRNALVADLEVKISPNNARMHNISYLDLKMSKSIRFKNNIEATLYLDWRNILDRFNVLWMASDGRIGGELKGLAVVAEGDKAYSGTITCLIGLSLDGTVTGVEVLKHAETPGLGAKIEECSWRRQLVGKGPEDMVWKVVKDGASADHEIDALPGATISSESVVNTVNRTVSELREALAASAREERQ